MKGYLRLEEISGFSNVAESVVLSTSQTDKLSLFKGLRKEENGKGKSTQMCLSHPSSLPQTLIEGIAS